uniref:Uncharacterized protein n=1 Tax=Picea sitchensis TaxID=3332 RepID=A0A6B9XSJ4_PICSI|nr:hypothetical protein Q903MT_gene3975 [Picea sitchensis]
MDALILFACGSELPDNYQLTTRRSTGKGGLDRRRKGWMGCQVGVGKKRDATDGRAASNTNYHSLHYVSEWLGHGIDPTIAS